MKTKPKTKPITLWAVVERHSGKIVDVSEYERPALRIARDFNGQYDRIMRFVVRRMEAVFKGRGADDGKA